jgi:hypothetical protein
MGKMMRIVGGTATLIRKQIALVEVTGTLGAFE